MGRDNKTDPSRVTPLPARHPRSIRDDEARLIAALVHHHSPDKVLAPAPLWDRLRRKFPDADLPAPDDDGYLDLSPGDPIARLRAAVTGDGSVEDALRALETDREMALAEIDRLRAELRRKDAELDDLRSHA